MSEPRVLLVTGEYPPMPGGISDYTHLLRNALQCEGVQPVVLSSREADADQTVSSWGWHTVSTIRRIVAERQIDVVHVQYQAGAFSMHPTINFLPALLRSTPVVTTFHDLRPPYLFPKAGRARYFMMRRMARWSSRVIVTNPADDQTLANSRIEVVRIPLGPSLPRPVSPSQPGNTVGYFGFPSKQKGFVLLVDALGRIPRTERPTLSIVGGQPPHSGQHGFMSQADVENLATRHGVAVNLTGFLAPQAASDALAGCRAIAFPFPAGATQRSSALIAALQTGRPVITTTPAQAGDLGQLEELTQLVQIVRPDSRLLQRALEEAMATSIQPQPLPPEYEWSTIAARHAEIYRSLVAEVGR